MPNDRQSSENVPSPTAVDGVRSVKLSELLLGATEIKILHDGETYRLKVTSRNKLILTK